MGCWVRSDLYMGSGDYERMIGAEIRSDLGVAGKITGKRHHSTVNLPGGPWRRLCQVELPSDTASVLGPIDAAVHFIVFLPRAEPQRLSLPRAQLSGTGEPCLDGDNR